MSLQTKTFTYGGLHSTAARYYRTELTLTEESVSPTENCSVLSYKLTLYSGNTRLSQWRTGAKIILNGKTYVHRDGTHYDNQISIAPQSSLILCEGQLKVPHESDGTGQLSVSFSVYHPTTADYTPGNFTYSGGEMTLTPALQISTVGATDAYIGGTALLAVSRKKSSHSHSLRYQIGSLSGWLGSDGQMADTEQVMESLSLAFPIPESFYEGITSGSTGVCYLYCRTYEDGHFLGETESHFTVMTRSSDCAPDLEGGVLDINPKTLALTGDAHILVRYASTAECTLTPILQKGAEVKSTAIEGVPGDYLLFEKTEKDRYRFTLTDSRGYTVGKEVAVTLLPYRKPTANATAIRPDPTDGTVQLTVRGSCYTGSFGLADNCLTVTCYLPDGSEVTAIPEIGEDSYTAVFQLTGFDHRSTHKLTVTVGDLLYGVDAKVTVQKGIPVFHWKEDGFFVNVPSAINGVHMAAATPKENAIRLFAPSGVFVAGSGLYGLADYSGWQGTGEVTVTTEENGDITLSLPEYTGTLLLFSPAEITVKEEEE
ncbi:MAG: hypothetical protein E7453_03430 [Ruminococcaceae bacterium]|nr:hypothetical protein [Oscillospiraceae bacterium]